MAFLVRLRGPDTVQLYDLARVERLYDALQLAYGGRLGGAVYMIGFAVEMTLKHAYFRFRGYSPNQTIGWLELKGAATHAVGLGVPYQRDGFHGLLFWAELLIRARRQAIRPLPGAFEGQLVRQTRRVAGNWKVDMRYRHIQPSEEEFRRSHYAALWMDQNATRLWR